MSKCFTGLYRFSYLLKLDFLHESFEGLTPVYFMVYRFDSLPLFPEETANVTFKADAATLRSAVHHFGKVESQVLPMELAFAEPGSVSASLPKAFEDYEDEEHHVLYKTVQDLKPAQDRVVSFVTNFPLMFINDNTLVLSGNDPYCVCVFRRSRLTSPSCPRKPKTG